MDESRFRLRGGSGSIAAVLQHAFSRLKIAFPLCAGTRQKKYKAPMRAAGGKSEGRAALGYRGGCKKSVRGSVVATPSPDIDIWRWGHVHRHGQCRVKAVKGLAQLCALRFSPILRTHVQPSEARPLS